MRCDAATAAILAAAGVPANPPPEDYRAEFLDYILAVRVVDSLDAAIATINRDSSNHSDTIVTADEDRRPPISRPRSTPPPCTGTRARRFTDGFEFGLGAEIGISTDRLHARGPMGLAELCSYKFVIDGTGQVRA